MSGAQEVPNWLDELRLAYESGAHGQFVLYGNVADRFPLDGRLVSLTRYMDAKLLGTFDIVFLYDPGNGLSLLRGGERFAEWPAAAQIQPWPHDPREAVVHVAGDLEGSVRASGNRVRVSGSMAPTDLGRIAAMSTKQLLNQRFRKIEKDQVFQEYKDKVGDIVTGTVRRTERGNVVIELGTAEAVLTHKERCHGDEFRTGDRIRCLLLEIREDPQRGREFVLSRANPAFVRRLLELEVAEIADKTVTIAAMARDPGYRTKIAVDSRDPKVDPVGACVGARGARVRNIVKELGGEKIDIIRYHAEPLKLLEEAIRPAKPRNVRIDERTRSIFFEVDEDDMRIAIGSKGRNARLTSKLMGWGLNIAKATHAPESVEAQLGERPMGPHRAARAPGSRPHRHGGEQLIG